MSVYIAWATQDSIRRLESGARIQEQGHRADAQRDTSARSAVGMKIKL